MLEDGIPVAMISDTIANREVVVGGHLDPGEAQAFTLADAHDGRLRWDWLRALSYIEWLKLSMGLFRRRPNLRI